MTVYLISSICVHAETFKNIFVQKYNIYTVLIVINNSDKLVNYITRQLLSFG